jgi:hypothetical protein
MKRTITLPITETQKLKLICESDYGDTEKYFLTEFHGLVHDLLCASTKDIRKTVKDFAKANGAAKFLKWDLEIISLTLQ